MQCQPHTCAAASSSGRWSWMFGIRLPSRDVAQHGRRPAYVRWMMSFRTCLLFRESGTSEEKWHVGHTATPRVSKGDVSGSPLFQDPQCFRIPGPNKHREHSFGIESLTYGSCNHTGMEPTQTIQGSWGPSRPSWFG